MENSALLDRIQSRLTALNLSERAASMKAVGHADLIRNFRRQKSKGPNTSSLVALAKVLEVSEQWLITGEDPPVMTGSFNDDTYDPIGVRFGGYVEAGAFRRTDDLNQEYEQRRIPLIPDPRYPTGEQYAFEVVGDSMNLAGILHGMHVLGVSTRAWERLHGELRDGLAVIVAHTLNGDPRRELTVKRLRIFRDRYELQPESTNETWKPLVYNFEEGHDGDERVEIVAVALNAVKLLV